MIKVIQVYMYSSGFICKHSCSHIFAWQSVVLRFFDPKQSLQVSCILWCYFSRWYSIIFRNASLLCSIVLKQMITSSNFWSIPVRKCMYVSMTVLSMQSKPICLNNILKFRVQYPIITKIIVQKDNRQKENSPLSDFKSF